MGVGQGRWFSHQRRRCFHTKWFLFTIILTTLCCYSFLQFFSFTPEPKNYFLDAEEYSQMTYTVDTPTCHILNISAWHKSILPFLTNVSSNKNCYKERQWTYINEKQNLVINMTAVNATGYSFSSIYCCYKTFSRPKVSLNEALDADSTIEFSSQCKSIQSEETKLSEGEEFIRVLCKSKYWPMSLDVVYRYFHAIPLPNTKITEKSKKMKKAAFKSPNVPQTPHVLILGIDSMSKLSFQRNMRRTRETLIEIGAHEMLGYTKLGDNTFPNAIAFMMGQTVEKINTICNYSSSSFSYSTNYLDYCPFVWKQFSAQNYITALIEDAPYLATYNYDKLGFLNQPVDFYFRPFMLGVSHYLPRKSYYYMECLGRQTVDEMVLDYISKIMQVSNELKLPSFIYSWMTNIAHGDLNQAQGADSTYETFIRSLDLNNTILFFMSDHGYRYGEIRQTFVGWYEDKLPNFWVYLPPRIKKNFPSWEESLKINTKRLASPLDLHATLKQILDTLNYPSITQTNTQTSGTMGHSLFQEIPKGRNCTNAGISNNFCACSVPQKMDVNDKNVIKAGNIALYDLNKRLPKQCSLLTLVNIHSAGVLFTEPGRIYIVSFYTQPGGFLFEGNVLENEWKLVGELLRMNKISTDVTCVHSDWEKFCYC